jgi:hypothetical protein
MKGGWQAHGDRPWAPRSLAGRDPEILPLAVPASRLARAASTSSSLRDLAQGVVQLRCPIIRRPSVCAFRALLMGRLADRGRRLGGPRRTVRRQRDRGAIPTRMVPERRLGAGRPRPTPDDAGRQMPRRLGRGGGPRAGRGSGRRRREGLRPPPRERPWLPTSMSLRGLVGRPARPGGKSMSGTHSWAPPVACAFVDGLCAGAGHLRRRTGLSRLRVRVAACGQAEDPRHCHAGHPRPGDQSGRAGEHAPRPDALVGLVQSGRDLLRHLDDSLIAHLASATSMGPPARHDLGTPRS